MKYRRLGRTDLDVSVICLGTMTWGEQNTEAEAHEQLDYALDQGVNFLDTAEMYPVPPRAETQGRTEAYIGSWLKARGNRDKVILATKVAGRDGPGGHIRQPTTRLDKAQINQAIDASLKRLGTDYVDLYQVHWPERLTNAFGIAEYRHFEQTDLIPIEETLDALAGLVKAGKVRHLGVSNESPWGVMRYLEAADRLGLPHIVSIQNAYSLVNRLFEIGHAEIAHREGVELLAYSPLGMGLLTGKYFGGARPANARLTLFSRFVRYATAGAQAAADAYVTLARQHGLDPAQMALAFVNSRPFLGANIIGATSLEQLKADIGSIDLDLSDEVLKGIEAIHRANPNPCP
ncbi:NADP(H)-dependent aldo-keto reductase [Zavarzinia compransoris]|uniref:Protein tas n=1 Tax=Zavarzinia compransoris TaxID=1264899 RepID=A0A317DY94_9PROT|nr:NADP(H)-dependent aldo-keto reductase [Zavarzinia compransoris]PWR18826.1 NADP(H)-dependent aldo-keto reductase [Zavarzinia compransoris]TDP48814.1 aryl-alcohol dehydrogenase-like predicted oxidoreductase [Zavarzinia compransoris]